MIIIIYYYYYTSNYEWSINHVLRR